MVLATTGINQVQANRRRPQASPLLTVLAHPARNTAATNTKNTLKELGKIEKQREEAHRKKERTEPRTSETDSDVHILKMAEGGYRPAVNAEVAVETKRQIILGVDVVNTVDQGQMRPMLEQIRESYGKYPDRHLVDKGFVTISEIESAEQHGVAVYAPIPSNYAAQGSGGTAPKSKESHFTLED